MRHLVFPLLIVGILGAAGIAPPLPDRLPIESSGRWTTHGPATGGFDDIAVNAGSSQTLYATTPHRGLLRSVDRGASWKSINQPGTPRFRGFAAAPGAAGTLYAFIANDLHRSRDAGSTWDDAGDVPAPGALSRVVVDPLRAETLYAATFEQFRSVQTLHLYKSSDAGASWTELPLRGSILRRLLIDPSNPSRLYAAPGQGYPVERSADGGLSWTPIGPPGVAGSFDVAADRSDFDTVYSAEIVGGAETGVFVSHDRGDTWARLASPPVTAVVSVTADPHRPGTLYVGGLPGDLFRTDDGGTTWRFVRRSPNVAAFDPVDPQVLYAGGARSSDGGLTWVTLPTGEIASTIPSLELDRGSVYAAGDDGDFPAAFRSDDGGLSWISLRTGLPEFFGRLTSLAVDPSDPSILYALSGSALFKSETKGTVWFPTGAGLPDGGVEVLVDPRDGRTVFVLSSLAGVYRSDDAGLSWQARNTGLTGPVFHLAMDPADSRHLYASGTRELFRTFNGGATWTSGPINIVDSLDPSRNSVRQIVIDPSRPWILFSVSPFGVVRSTDAGDTWSILPVPTRAGSEVTAVAVNPADPSKIFAGSSDGGVFRSTDGGSSWRSLGSVPADPAVVPPSIDSLAVDPENGLLHAGTEGNGVWEIAIPADLPRTRIVAPR